MGTAETIAAAREEASEFRDHATAMLGTFYYLANIAEAQAAELAGRHREGVTTAADASIGALRHRLDQEAFRLDASTSADDRAAAAGLWHFIDQSSEPVLARIVAIIRGENE